MDNQSQGIKRPGLDWLKEHNKRAAENKRAEGGKKKQEREAKKEAENAQNKLSKQRSNTWDSFITSHQEMLSLEAEFLGMIPYGAMGPEPFGLDNLMNDVRPILSTMSYTIIRDKIIDYLDLAYMSHSQYLPALTNIVNNAKKHKMGHVFNGIIYELYFILSLETAYNPLRADILSKVDFPQNDGNKNIDKMVNDCAGVLSIPTNKAVNKRLDYLANYLKNDKGIEKFADGNGYLYRMVLRDMTKGYLSAHPSFLDLINRYKKLNDAERDVLRIESLNFFNAIIKVFNNPFSRLKLLVETYYKKNDKLGGATVKDLLDGIFRDTETEMIERIRVLKGYIDDNSTSLAGMMGIVKTAGYEQTPIYKALNQMNELLNGSWVAVVGGRTVTFYGQNELLNLFIDKSTFAYNVRDIHPTQYLGLDLSMKSYQKKLDDVILAKDSILPLL